MNRPSLQGGADDEELRTTLRIFAVAWPDTAPHRPLREDLANQIAAVVGRSCPGPGAPTVTGDAVGGQVRSLLTGSLESLAGLIGVACWGAADRGLLADLAGDLRAAGFDEADTVEKAVAGIDRRDVIGQGVLLGGGHVLFWGLLLGLYPWGWARPVRAFFFWNPWPRRLFGLFYVGLLLAYVPWLRRLLFVPYRRSLLADADLEHLNERAYFAGSRVRDERGQAEILLDTAIPEVGGQLVLEGDSGLGKSLFLRRLAKRSRRIAVYLPARRCEAGVIEAVQAKLPGPAGDPDFLRQLVSAGAVDVIIDGLNEVAAETRGKITEFVERHFEGNIILATQPMEWRRPANAQGFRLLPLAREEIEAFLVSREAELPADAPLRGEAFVKAARVFLARAFDSRAEAAERLAMQRALANPMDLVTVAQILATGREPDLLALQEQSYALMTEDYAATNQGAAFPLDRFAEHVYALRLQDSMAPSEAEFPNEVAAMERHKILVRRVVPGDRQGPVVFRHDKVMEFFLYHAFAGKDRAERQVKHNDDPRFRGVYLLMALRLPLEAAQALRELVQDHAVDSGDHSLGDEFWRLLRARGQKPAPAQAA